MKYGQTFLIKPRHALPNADGQSNVIVPVNFKLHSLEPCALFSHAFEKNDESEWIYQKLIS